MLISPFDPVAFHIGPLPIHWYGLAYATTFLALLFGGRYQLQAMNNDRRPCTPSQFESLVTWLMVGVLLGGRLGYMLFYNPMGWSDDPWSILWLWQGGMSFHGGALGCIIALWLFAKKHRLAFFALSDTWVVWVPLGLALGRGANFINGELWGRVTTVPWGMVFPWVDNKLRHPSQLYEMVLEGFVLGMILLWFSKKNKPEGWLSGCFLLGYGLFRFTVEWFRAPDVQLGVVFMDALTMGQCLSLPMVCIGGYLMLRHRSKGEGK